jgi:hypothetical protein
VFIYIYEHDVVIERKDWKFGTQYVWEKSKREKIVKIRLLLSGIISGFLLIPGKGVLG